MSNMSYCRFSNTYYDLVDCIEHLSDKDLSETEAKKRWKMMRLMAETVSTYSLDKEDELEGYNPDSENYYYKNEED